MRKGRQMGLNILCQVTLRVFVQITINRLPS
jgi:hypothetical protein